MKIRAFTMAEVLITLGIIGVVAAMTLPSLITKNQNKALETGLKKNYSVILQAFDMYQAEHGERLKAEDVNIGCTSSCLKKIIMPYFKIIRDCGYGAQVEKACIPYTGNESADDERNFRNYRTFSGEVIKMLNLLDDGQFILQDGSIILINNTASFDNMYISVDVNGYLKNPNRWGQDLFTFQLMRDGTILPMGASGTAYEYEDGGEYCSADSTNQYNGIACTYKALTDKNYFNNLPR